MKPAVPITDGRFEYSNSASTDVRATWNRLCPGWNKRKTEKPPTVVPLPRKKA